MHPHRLRIRLEQQAVPRLAFPQQRLGPLPLDGRCNLRGHELEDVFLTLAVARAWRVGLHDENAHSALARFQRHADPIERGCAEELHLAQSFELAVPLGRQQQRNARAQHIIRQPAPQRTRRRRRVVLVHPIWKLEQAARFVIQRDIQVGRGEEFGHDPVNRAEHLRQARHHRRRIRNPVQGALQLLGALALRHIAHHGAEMPAIRLLRRCDRQLHCELMAAAVQRRDLDAPPENGAVARGDKVRQAAPVRIAISRRNDGVRQLPADRRCRRPSEHRLGVRVPAGDDAARVHRDHGVERGGQHRVENGVGRWRAVATLSLARWHLSTIRRGLRCGHHRRGAHATCGKA